MDIAPPLEGWITLKFLDDNSLPREKKETTRRSPPRVDVERTLEVPFHRRLAL